MMTQEQEQHEMISDLFYNISIVSDLGDFKTRRELADYIVTKAQMMAENASNYGYNEAERVANEIATRAKQIRDIKKQHLINRRLKEMLNSVNW